MPKSASERQKHHRKRLREANAVVLSGFISQEANRALMAIMQDTGIETRLGAAEYALLQQARRIESKGKSE